jgi:hypothetical protein
LDLDGERMRFRGIFARRGDELPGSWCGAGWRGVYQSLLYCGARVNDFDVPDVGIRSSGGTGVGGKLLGALKTL